MFSSGGGGGGLLQSLATKAKAFAAGVSEIELKVLEATNEDKWGPHGSDMKEIARAAQEAGDRALIMNVIWQRLQEQGDNWRLCYKGLLLCDFLIRQGPMRVVEELQRNVYIFERLRDNFAYKDAEGRDQGINVRQRARELATLLSNSNKIQEERDKARQNANKYTGVSAADMQRGGGGYSSAGGSYGGGGNNSYGSNGGGNGGGGGGYGYSSGGGGTAYSGGSSGYGGSVSAGHSRTGSGLPSKATGTADDEDPFEATRRRIERLRAQEAEQDMSQDTHVPTGSINMDGPTNLFPESKGRMGPKKLSEVKVDPAIVATIGGTGALAPPPPAGSVVRGSTTRSTPISSTNHTPSSSNIDLFAGLHAPGSSPSPPPAAASAAGAIDWDALSSVASAQPTAPQPQTQLDLFAAATAVPAPAAVKPIVAPPKAASDLLAFDSPLSAGRPSPAAPTTTQANNLAADLFGALAGSGHAQAAAPQAPDLFADPFGAPAALQGRPAAAPAAAPVADLFADPFGPTVSAQPKPSAAPVSTFSDPFGAAPSQPKPNPTNAVLFSDPFSPAVAAPSQPAVMASFDDPFGSSIPPLKPAGAPAMSFSDPFAPAPSQPAASAGFNDPFGAVVPSMPNTRPLAQPTPVPALSAPKPTSKSRDPFADLLG